MVHVNASSDERERRREKGEALLPDHFMELGLARCEHPPEVWPAEAALGAAPGLPHDALELPVALARQRQELRERKVTADAAGDQGGGHDGNIEAGTED